MLNDTDMGGLDMFLAGSGRAALRRVRDGDAILAAGAMLGNWRVEAFLGRGGSGEVYRVVHSIMRTPAAAKVLTKDDSTAAKRFSDEIAFLNEWRESVGTADPSRPQPFPRYYESGEIDGRPFVIFEGFDGLFDEIRFKGPETVKEINDLRFSYFPRHILPLKHEYRVERMEKKDTEADTSDESFDFHLAPNRIRTVAEIQLFADVFSISFKEARRILTKAGRRCEQLT